MKKLFFLAVVILALSLMINFESDKISIKTDALADGAQCCPEIGSLCCYDDGCMLNYYYASNGCNSGKDH